MVVGGESMIQAVYRSSNLPGLRPCLQNTNEPSLAFVSYDMSKGRQRRRDYSRGATPTLLNGGCVKVGMILVGVSAWTLCGGLLLKGYRCFSIHDTRYFEGLCLVLTAKLQLGNERRGSHARSLQLAPCVQCSGWGVRCAVRGSYGGTCDAVH